MEAHLVLSSSYQEAMSFFHKKRGHWHGEKTPLRRYQILAISGIAIIFLKNNSLRLKRITSQGRVLGLVGITMLDSTNPPFSQKRRNNPSLRTI